MSNQKKKMNFPIEGFKRGVIMDPEYGDKAWNILEHAIHQIYNHNTNDLSFDDLYRFFLIIGKTLLYLILCSLVLIIIVQLFSLSLKVYYIAVVVIGFFEGVLE